MKTKSYWVISKSDYETKEGALKALQTWQEQGELEEGSKVYEITQTTKVFYPALELKEIM